MNSGELKLFAAILVIVLILAGVAIYPTLTERRKPSGPVVYSDPVKAKVSRADLFPEGMRYKGDKNAPYLLVEFADYQCPLCASSVERVNEILEKHKGKFSFVFHHVQIQGGHQNAVLMAQAAEAAGLQGKFWEMHEKLFQNQRLFQGIPPSDAMDVIYKLAKEVGLDMLKFGADMKSDQVEKALARSSKIAAEADVNVTPTFFVVPPDGKTVRVGALRDLLNWVEKPENLK